MTDQELLAKFVADGCGLQVQEVWLHPVLAAVAEIVETKRGRMLYHVTQFATDQHCAHVTPFDSIQRVGEVGIGFYQGGKLAAYVAPYIEWPDLDYHAAMAERAEWIKELSTPDHREAWDDFVRSERELLTREQEDE